MLRINATDPLKHKTVYKARTKRQIFTKTHIYDCFLRLIYDLFFSDLFDKVFLIYFKFFELDFSFFFARTNVKKSTK